MTNNQHLIQKAIDKAGYDCEYTESNLVSCFLDYVDCGVWDITTDEAEDMIESGELTVSDMCNALMRLR